MLLSTRRVISPNTGYHYADAKEGGSMKKGVVLITIIIVTLLITVLAAVVIFVMTQQAYIAENKIRRNRGYYAAMAAVTEVQAMLRNNRSLPVAPNNFITIGDNTDGPPYPIKVYIESSNVSPSDPDGKFKGLTRIKTKVVY